MNDLVYAADQLDRSIGEGNGVSTSTYFNHVDHLNSTRVVTNASGTVEQVLDSYPFGAPLRDEQYGSFDQTKRYSGHDFDSESGLHYMGARFQNPEFGIFVSQDPVCLALGNTPLLESKTNQPFEEYLSDPASHNCLTYARNNPMKYIDPNGEFAFGVGFSGNANAPGIYGQTSDTLVLAVSRTGKVEIGWVKSVAGGATSAVLGADVTANVLFSPDAQSVSDLEGGDITVGGSVRTFVGPTLGVDVATSIGEDGSIVNTYTGSVGLGGVVTPYVVPVEVHGGVEYSDEITSHEIYNPERRREEDSE